MKKTPKALRRPGHQPAMSLRDRALWLGAPLMALFSVHMARACWSSGQTRCDGHCTVCAAAQALTGSVGWPVSRGEALPAAVFGVMRWRMR